MPDWLPDDVVTRRKMDFDLPIEAWMRGILRPKLQEALVTSAAKWFLSKKTRDLFFKRTSSHWTSLSWGFLVLLHWLDMNDISD